MKVLLDTNTCIALMKGREKAVLKLCEFEPSECTIPEPGSGENRHEEQGMEAFHREFHREGSQRNCKW